MSRVSSGRPKGRHYDSHAETDRNVRFKRTCERRDPSVSRETASEGPSPAQLTELRLLYTMSRSRDFPRRRTGSRNRRFRSVSADSVDGVALVDGLMNSRLTERPDVFPHTLRRTKDR